MNLQTPQGCCDGNTINNPDERHMQYPRYREGKHEKWTLKMVSRVRSLTWCGCAKDHAGHGTLEIG